MRKPRNEVRSQSHAILISGILTKYLLNKSWHAIPLCHSPKGWCTTPLSPTFGGFISKKFMTIFQKYFKIDSSLFSWSVQRISQEQLIDFIWFFFFFSSRSGLTSKNWVQILQKFLFAPIIVKRANK